MEREEYGVTGVEGMMVSGMVLYIWISSTWWRRRKSSKRLHHLSPPRVQ